MLTLRREGASPGDRWKWNETIGPVENRPGRQGKNAFSFFTSVLMSLSSRGLGLREYRCSR